LYFIRLPPPNLSYYMFKEAVLKKVTVTEFKNHQSSWLQKVVEGARLAITRRGKGVASVEPPQPVLPFEEKLTVKELQGCLLEEVVLVNPQNLENLVGIAKSLNEKSAVVSVRTRVPEKIEDLHRDILRVSEKLDLENLEMLVNIVRLYAKDGLKGK